MSWSMTSIREVTGRRGRRLPLLRGSRRRGAIGATTPSGVVRPGPVEPGATVEVRVANYPHTYHVRIRDVQDGRRIVCEVKPVGRDDRLDVRRDPDRGRVQAAPHDRDQRAPMERPYRLLEGQYTRMLHEETRRLAELVGEPAGRVVP